MQAENLRKISIYRTFAALFEKFIYCYTILCSSPVPQIPRKQVDRDNEYTSQVLLRLGFRWSEPDSDYVGKMLTAISQLGFFEV